VVGHTGPVHGKLSTSLIQSRRSRALTFVMNEFVGGCADMWSDGRLVESVLHLAVGAGDQQGAEVSVEVVRPCNSVRSSTGTFARPLPGIRVDELRLQRPDRVSTPTDCGRCCARSKWVPVLLRPTHACRFREPVARLGGVNLPALVP
jgi:hypothetical protein